MTHLILYDTSSIIYTLAPRRILPSGKSQTLPPPSEELEETLPPSALLLSLDGQGTCFRQALSSLRRGRGRSHHIHFRMYLNIELLLYVMLYGFKETDNIGPGSTPEVDQHQCLPIVDTGTAERPAFPSTLSIV